MKILKFNFENIKILVSCLCHHNQIFNDNYYYNLKCYIWNEKVDFATNWVLEGTKIDQLYILSQGWE